MKATRVCSRGMNRSPPGSGSSRATLGGTLTRANRVVSSVRLRTSTPTLSERLEM